MLLLLRYYYCSAQSMILSLLKMLVYVALIIALLSMLYWWWLERPQNQPQIPQVYYSNDDNVNPSSKSSSFCRRLVDAMPLVHEMFTPPLLWGRNGHIQTFLFGIYDRVDAKRPHGMHCTIRASDGATIIYDIYESKQQSQHNERSTVRRRSSTTNVKSPDITLLICPGIANSSLSPYISTFVYYAQHAGYRCAVLGHLGSDRYSELTAPRIFSYGGTADFELMLIDMLRRHPQTHFILIGFSMGGNVVTKFLSLMSADDRQAKHVLAAVSLCQGYDIAKAMHQYLSSWQNLAKMYNYLLALRMRKVITRHQTVLLGHAAMRRNPDSFEKLKKFTSLADIDRVYSMHVQSDSSRYATLDDFYRDMSSLTNLHSVRQFPILFVNAEDDPIIPLNLVRGQIQNYCENVNDQAMLLVTRHGGHLGFFDSAVTATSSQLPQSRGILSRRRSSSSSSKSVSALTTATMKTCRASLVQASKFNWLDKLVLQYCDAVVNALDADGAIEAGEDLSKLRPSSVHRQRRPLRRRLVQINNAADSTPTAKPNKKKTRTRRRDSEEKNATPSSSLHRRRQRRVHQDESNNNTNAIRQILDQRRLAVNGDGESSSSSRSSSRSSSADGDAEDTTSNSTRSSSKSDNDSVATTTSGGVGSGGGGSVSACDEYYLDDEFLRANNNTLKLLTGNLVRLGAAGSVPVPVLQALDEAAEVAPASTSSDDVVAAANVADYNEILSSSSFLARTPSPLMMKSTIQQCDYDSTAEKQPNKTTSQEEEHKNAIPKAVHYCW